MCLKLQKLEATLRNLNHEAYSNISTRVSQKSKELKHIQLLFSQNPFDTSLHARDASGNYEYISLLANEEAFLASKVRVKWLKNGDRNTAFFHRSILSHNARNRILSFERNDESIVNDYPLVKQMVVDFYQGIFCEDKVFYDSDFHFIRSFVSKKFPDPSIVTLVDTIDPSLIKKTMFSLDSSSAPGSDRYNANFFISNWDIARRMLQMPFCILSAITLCSFLLMILQFL